MSDKKYSFLINEASYKKEAYYAFSSKFEGRGAFESFYQSLPSDFYKDQFLRVSNLYLFMVKTGDWHLKDTGYNKNIEYFSNSYKAITIFSLIESLSDEEYVGFHGWLREQGEIFPIQDMDELNILHEKYKKSFGSIRRCVSFFENLPSNIKDNLCSSITIKGKSVQSIKKFAQILYDFRSKFVHQGDLILMLDSSPIFDVYNKNLILSKFSIELLQDTFEEGVIAYFNNKITQ
ncbi:hypothetical protein BMS3Abin15_00007 [bacterium BMS3Abin15]|nr:hypothetical protein BMS3Abin15_00007 [bacterium BMS3Abin15]